MGVLNDNTRQGASAAGEAYEIEKSLRFNSGDSPTLTRTFGTPTNTDKYTFSCWLKRTEFHDSAGHFSLLGNAGWSVVRFTADRLYWRENGIVNITTTRKWRDPSSWYHIVLRYDSSDDTEADRAQIWINGVRETDFTSASYPSQNQNSFINSAIAQILGGYSTSEQFFDGYLTEINFVDGQGLDPDNFGKTDPNTGQWIPKEYKGTYGDNGYYLNFSDNSNTTSGTLGADSSGNSNDWTPNNFSVATDDELACDSFSDTPTNNWCTLSPINNPNGATLTNGGLAVSMVSASSAGDTGVNATFGVTSGKWYWEAICTGTGNRGWAGVTDSGHKSGSWTGYNYSIVYRHTGSTAGTSGTSNSDLDAAWGGDEWLTFCFDADNGQIWYSREAAPDISGTANVTGLTLGGIGHWQPFVYESGGTPSSFTFNFGASAAGFKYTPPTGYKALNASNLPEPTIKKGTDHMKPVLYTGDGVDDRTITVGWKPDFTWIKNSTEDSTGHYLYDSVRGATKYLHCYGDYSEQTDDNTLQAFESNGFEIGTNSDHNGDTKTFISWNWLAANGTAANENGSIDSTVSVNANAGFSIVSWVGTGANATVGHGLGVKPEMIIVKNRDDSENWRVYHEDAGATHSFYLNDDDAKIDAVEVWNDTEPTSSVFTVGTHNSANGSSGDDDKMIAYCFSSVEGYSKVGMYLANNIDDGVFVYTGFAPSWIMIKNRDTTGPWNIFDTKRETYNPREKNLRANTADQEDSARDIDFLSNGFKLRSHGTEMNDPDEAEYLYLAFADTSFKYATAR